MSLIFDETYVRNTQYSVAMIVANSVVNDSRVLKTAFSLSKQGYKVHVYGLNAEAKIATIEGYPFKITLISNPRFEMKKKKIWIVDDNRYDIELFLKKLTNGFVDLIRQEKHDILHTHDMYGLPIGAELKKGVLAGVIGWIHDLHEYVEGCTNLPDYIRLFMWEKEKEYIKLPDVLTTVSPILSELIERNYGVTLPALVLNTPRITDFDSFNKRSIRSSLGLESNIPLMVYNGGVKPPRGVQFVVKALAYLPEVHLVLLTNSTGSFMDELQAMSKEDGSFDRLHIHPFVPNNEVTTFVRDASLGVNPVTIYENSDLALPNKIFEYIHAGVPIVSSATTMMKKFLKEHQCGKVFEAGNVQDLVASVKFVLKEYPNGIPGAGEGSDLAKQYCWEAQEKVLISQYDKMLSAVGKTQHNEIDNLEVLHLPTHAANQPKSLVDGLRGINISAKNAAFGSNKYNYLEDIEIEPQPFSLAALNSYFSIQGLGAFDVYHYHARPLLFSKNFKTPTGADLVFLKSQGKKVFFHYRGSEARLASIFKKSTPYNYVDEQAAQQDNTMPFQFEEEKQKSFRDFLFDVCDDVFVTDPELQCYAPNAAIVPRAISLDEINNLPSKKRKMPLVVHAPSRSAVKGTKYVLDAVDKLRNEGLNFEFKLVKNVPHEEALKIYADANIVVDQLRIGWYGVLAVEGMALGKAVVSYVRHDLRHYLPYPAPLAYATPDNVVDVLRHLILNPDAVLRYGKSGRDFISSYHQSSSVARSLLHLYKLHRNHYLPEKEAKYFKNGVKAGLSFGELDFKKLFIEALQMELSGNVHMAMEKYRLIVATQVADSRVVYSKSRLAYLTKVVAQ